MQRCPTDLGRRASSLAGGGLPRGRGAGGPRRATTPRRGLGGPGGGGSARGSKMAPFPGAPSGSGAQEAGNWQPVTPGRRAGPLGGRAGVGLAREVFEETSQLWQEGEPPPARPRSPPGRRRAPRPRESPPRASLETDMVGLLFLPPRPPPLAQTPRRTPRWRASGGPRARCGAGPVGSRPAPPRPARRAPPAGGERARPPRPPPPRGHPASGNATFDAAHSSD